MTKKLASKQISEKILSNYELAVSEFGDIDPITSKCVVVRNELIYNLGSKDNMIEYIIASEDLIGVDFTRHIRLGDDVRDKMYFLIAHPKANAVEDAGVLILESHKKINDLISDPYFMEIVDAVQNRLSAFGLPEIAPLVVTSGDTYRRDKIEKDEVLFIIDTDNDELPEKLVLNKKRLTLFKNRSGAGIDISGKKNLKLYANGGFVD